MDKRIVMEPSRNIRKLARRMLEGCWGTAVAAVFITELVARVPSMLISSLFPSGAAVGIENLYQLLVQAPLAVGLAMVLMNIARNRPTAPMNVFYGFEYLGKAILLQLLMGIFIFLWSLLFVIPGIIAFYSYRYAFYIFADDPSKGIMQCLRESKYLTKGNKGQMFILDLSFIGWYLLSAIPAGLFGGFYAMTHYDALYVPGMTQAELTQMMMNQNGWMIGSEIAAFALVFVEVYAAMASICMYDLMNGNLMIQKVPAGSAAAGGIPPQTGSFGDTQFRAQYPVETEGTIVSEEPTQEPAREQSSTEEAKEPKEPQEPKENESDE